MNNTTTTRAHIKAKNRRNRRRVLAVGIALGMVLGTVLISLNTTTPTPATTPTMVQVQHVTLPMDTTPAPQPTTNTRTILEDGTVYDPSMVVPTTTPTPTTYTTPATSVGVYHVAPIAYTQDDLVLLAKAIDSEALGESLKGKHYVATVIMNRVQHYNARLHGGPTVRGVVMKSGKFDGVGTKLFNKAPSQDSLTAAKASLEGYRTLGYEVVYYYNPRTATDKSFTNSVTIVATVGNHVFGYCKSEVK